MFETIGMSILGIGLLIIMIYYGTRPTKEQKRENEKKRFNQENEAIKKTNKDLFIVKYKDLLINMFNNSKTIPENKIKEKLYEYYNYSNEEISRTIREMQTHSLLELNFDKNELHSKGQSLFQIKYVFPNFINFCDYMELNEKSRYVFYLDDNKWIEQRINLQGYEEYAPIDSRLDIHSTVEYGILTHGYSPSCGKFLKNDIFYGDYSLYIAAKINFGFKGFPLTQDKYNQFKTKYFCFDKLGNYYVHKVKGLNNDLSFDEYRKLYFEFMKDFKQSSFYSDMCE